MEKIEHHLYSDMDNMGKLHKQVESNNQQKYISTTQLNTKHYGGNIEDKF